MAGLVDRVVGKVKGELRTPVKKDDNPIRWGVMGIGYMAKTFSTAIDGNKGGIVVAVASRSKEKAESFASKHGKPKAYGSYAELVADGGVDIVYIATPTKYHYENIKMCLEAGKNVLCEKPIVSSSDQLQELMNLAKEKNCFLMEGMWMYCLPSYQKAVEWISQGRIGTPELVKADFYKREVIDTLRTIFDKNQGGGVLRDYGVYAVAFPIGLTEQEPTVTGYSRKSAYGIDSDWQIHMNFGEMQAFVSVSSDFQSLSKAAVMGTNGTIEWDSQFNRTNTVNLYDAQGKQVDQFKTSYQFEGYEYELEEAQKMVRENKKESDMVPLSRSLTIQKSMAALLRNAKA